MEKDVGNLRTKLSFEKTGDSNLTDLSRDLKGIRSEMNNFRSSSRAYRTSMKGMRQESDILTRRLQVQRERVAELRRRYEEAKRTTGENSARTKELAAQYNNAQAEMKRTEQQLDRLNRMIKVQESSWTKLGQHMETAGKKMQDIGRRTTDFGRSYSMRVTAPIVAAGVAALKVGMDFEEGMSKVQAISGATGSDLELLRNQAKELGETTRFSATEAASGMEFLAMAGWETQDILKGMPGLLDLAASSNMDLGRAADITSNIISGFNMEASESTRVADVLAKGASTANTNVEQLGGAMKYAAPIANTLGLEIEGLTASVGFMSDAGIQGEQAGRQLRQGLLRLANPTGEASKLIKKLGIEVFDADGNMKEMHEVVGELEKGMKGMDSQTRAASLAILFGAESTAGWSTLLDRGSKDLKNYTKELQDSEGAAAEMAKVMQDNAKGAMVEFKSALEGAGIAAAEHIIPAVTDITKKATELIRKFGELDDETQKQILKWLALTAAVGPTAVVLGHATTALGGVLRVGGSVSKMIGRAGGTAGLIGSLGALGPGAIAGVAVAGIAAVGVGLYALKKDTKDAEKANLDLATSLIDKASALEEAKNSFDSLSSKAKISNEQLAEMYSLNQRIAGSTNPGEIEELSKRYEYLAKSSGLTKEEIKELFGANDLLIKQTPDIKKSVSEQGDEFVKTTEKVDEYISTLHELSAAEIEIQRAKALAEERDLLDEIKTKEQEIKDLSELRLFTAEAQNTSAGEHSAMLSEIDAQLKEAKKTGEDTYLLDEKREALLAVMTDEYDEHIGKLDKKAEKVQEELDAAELQLEKNNALLENADNLLLKQVGINEEGQKGLIQLDDTIAKNEAELRQLEDKLAKSGELTDEEKERYTKLSEATNKQKEMRDHLHDEVGVYANLNSLAENKLSKLDEENRKKIESLAKSSEIKVEEGNIVKQIQDKNAEIDKSISKYEKELEKNGANKDEINKQIKELEAKKLLNNSVLEQILKELGVWDKVKDSIESGAKKEKEKGKATDDTTIKQKKQGDQIEKNNQKTDAGTKKEQERTKEAGKDVDKDVNVSDKGKTDEINRKAAESKDKNVHLREVGLAFLNTQASSPRNKNVNLQQVGLSRLNEQASAPVTKKVTLWGKVQGALSKIWPWEKGTPPSGHPGGMAMIGEKGRELVQLPSGETFVSPNSHTILDLPKGTHVMPNRETEKLLRSLPRYAEGTPDYKREMNQLMMVYDRTNESNIVVQSNLIDDKPINNLLQATLEQNKILMQLLQKNSDVNVNFDMGKFGRFTDEEQGKRINLNGRVAF